MQSKRWTLQAWEAILPLKKAVSVRLLFSAKNAATLVRYKGSYGFQ